MMKYRDIKYSLGIGSSKNVVQEALPSKYELIHLLENPSKSEFILFTRKLLLLDGISLEISRKEITLDIILTYFSKINLQSPVYGLEGKVSSILA